MINLHLRGMIKRTCKLLIFVGEEFERENPALENCLLLVPNYSTLDTQQPDLEINDRGHLEDLQLIARARAVGVQYEFAQPGVVENRPDYRPLRLVVSGTAGTGKSYVVKCLQRLVRKVFGANDAIQVITPTGSAAYLIQGSTVHSFLGIPTGGKVLQRVDGACRSSARENSEKVPQFESSGCG